MELDSRQRVVAVLLDRYGRSDAADAGIRLVDKPGPLYQLLVLAMLLSARISADVAIGAALLLDRWHGDLRRLRAQGRDGEDGDIATLLTAFPGIGPAGASIFLREVQGIWPDAAPYVDTMMTRGARKIGLPGQPAKLGEILSASEEPAALAAALVRVALSDRAAAEVTAALPG